MEPNLLYYLRDGRSDPAFLAVKVRSLFGLQWVGIKIQETIGARVADQFWVLYAEVMEVI